MLIKDAKAITGSLGSPSKMPGTSYGISAEHCLVGGKLVDVEGSTCSGCYALKANYRYQSVAKAHAKRLEGLYHPMWTTAMVRMLKNKHKNGKLPPVHRWHDSGDVQSELHLANICEVARQTPELDHWLPTREIKILMAFIKKGGNVPANLCIRVSATMVDGSATKAWPTTSGVHHAKPAQGAICPAPTQNNTCGSCRKCWDRSVPHVSYHKH